MDGEELKEEEVLWDFGWSDNSPMHFYYKRDGLKHPARRIEFVYEKPDIPGVDHQSNRLLDTFLKVKGINLKEFILNKKYIVVIDGDETDTWSEFKNCGLVDKSQIIEEYGAWQAYLDTKEGEEDDTDFGEES